MAKPALTPIDHGQASWDADLNDNFGILFGANPTPIPEVANYAALPSAAAYTGCAVITTDTYLLWISDGSTWHPLTKANASATETPCGYDAVNSQVIYRKSFTFTLANAGAQTQAHSITNLDVAKGAFFRIEAVASDGTTVRQLPWYDGTDHLEVKVDATDVTITSTKDETGSDAFVTLFYTKTA